MKPEDLQKIIADDEFGLLDAKPAKAKQYCGDELLIKSFEEINDFFVKKQREPQHCKDIQESKLYYRLQAIKENPDKIAFLKSFDNHNLLPDTNVNSVNSLDDIYQNDLFQEIAGDDQGIFTLKNVPQNKGEVYIGKHKPCKNFKMFEPLFKQCHEDLKTGEKILQPFAIEQMVNKGMFFVLKGVLVYIDKIGEPKWVHGKRQARLRCIYENGTESNILNRSLARALYRDGRRVVSSKGELFEETQAINITDEDQPSGYIYVLRSLSNKDEIKSLQDLHKIGFSEVSASERIKNAEYEPTFLMASVEIVAQYKTYNMNTQKFEALLHKFFGSCCVNIEIYDANKTSHAPQEWFQVPINIIDTAIELIISGDIINYEYKKEIKEIIEKSA